MSAWSREKPIAPGFYMVMLERGWPGFAELHDDGSYRNYFLTNANLDLEYWGPRVEFPDPPAEPPSDGWWEVYLPGLSCFVARYVVDGEVFAECGEDGSGHRLQGRWTDHIYDWDRSTRLVPGED